MSNNDEKICFTNECIFSIVKAKLITNEKIIAKLSNFYYKAEQESKIGSKHAYVTSLGRIIAYDKGGLFIGYNCYTNENIEFIFNPLSCEFNMYCSGKLCIQLEISVNDYLKLASEIVSFVIDYKGLCPVISLHNDYYAADVICDKKSILISDRMVSGLISTPYATYFNKKNKSKDIIIDLRLIKDINYKSKLHQCLILFYSEELNSIVECKLIFLNSDIYDNINTNYNKIDSELLLFNYVKQDDKISCETISEQEIHFSLFKNVNVTTVTTKNKYKSFVVYNDEKIKIFDYKTCEIKKHLNINECVLIENPYSSNTFIDYKTGILLVSNSIKFEKIITKKVNDFQDNYCVLSVNNKDYLLKAYLLEGFLKLIDYSSELLINYKDIKSIDILDNNYNGIVKLEISALSNIQIVTNYTLYQSLIDNWTNEKLKAINNLQEAYYNWSKTLRDTIIYYYFTLPAELKGSLDDILNGKNISSLQKQEKIKIINVMYNVLKQYKNSLMEFSSYFSNELLEEHAKDNNSKFKVAFDGLQHEMIGIYNQITRHIDSSINNLNYLASYIYPDLDIREAIEKKNKTRSKVITTLYGLATLVGGLHYLMIGGIYGSSILDSMSKSKIIDDMEDEKINIYLNNTIDEFNIFMNTMIPKYVGDINNMVNNFISSIRQFYENEDIDFLKICIKNYMIFLETPINDQILKRKQILVDIIQYKAQKFTPGYVHTGVNGIKKISRVEYYKQLEGGL